MSEDNFENDIKRAVGRVRVKEILQQHEMRRKKQRKIRLMLYISTAGAVAACAVFLVINIVSVNRFKELGGHYYNSTQIFASRGGSTDAAGGVYSLIGEFEYEAAVNKADSLLAVVVAQRDTTSDPATEYGLFMEIDQTRWLRALALMRMGEVDKAENALRQIADDQRSVYRDKATEILNRLIN